MSEGNRYGVTPETRLNIERLRLGLSQSEQIGKLQIALGLFANRATDDDTYRLSVLLDMTEEGVRKMLTLCNHAYIDKAESLRTDPRMELRAD